MPSPTPSGQSSDSKQALFEFVNKYKPDNGMEFDEFSSYLDDGGAEDMFEFVEKHRPGAFSSKEEFLSDYGLSSGVSSPEPNMVDSASGEEIASPDAPVAPTEDLGFFENLANSFSNQWEQTKRIPEQIEQFQTQINEKVIDGLDAVGFDMEGPRAINDAKAMTDAMKTQMAAERFLPTTEFTDVIDSGSPQDAAEWLTSAAISVLGSAVRAVASRGVSIPIESIGGAYDDALLEKARVSGKSVWEIAAQDEDPELAPAIAGSIAVVLEKFGLDKVFNRNVLKKIPLGKFTAYIADKVNRGGAEGLTEGMQDIVQQVSTQVSTGQDVNIAWDSVLNSSMSGLGGGIVMAAGVDAVSKKPNAEETSIIREQSKVEQADAALASELPDDMNQALEAAFADAEEVAPSLKYNDLEVNKEKADELISNASTTEELFNIEVSSDSELQNKKSEKIAKIQDEVRKQNESREAEMQKEKAEADKKAEVAAKEKEKADGEERIVRREQEILEAYRESSGRDFAEMDVAMKDWRGRGGVNGKDLAFQDGRYERDLKKFYEYDTKEQATQQDQTIPASEQGRQDGQPTTQEQNASQEAGTQNESQGQTIEIEDAQLREMYEQGENNKSRVKEMAVKHLDTVLKRVQANEVKTSKVRGLVSRINNLKENDIAGINKVVLRANKLEQDANYDVKVSEADKGIKSLKRNARSFFKKDIQQLADVYKKEKDYLKPEQLERINEISKNRNQDQVAALHTEILNQRNQRVANEHASKLFETYEQDPIDRDVTLEDDDGPTRAELKMAQEAAAATSFVNSPENKIPPQMEGIDMSQLSDKDKIVYGNAIADYQISNVLSKEAGDLIAKTEGRKLSNELVSEVTSAVGETGKKVLSNWTIMPGLEKALSSRQIYEFMAQGLPAVASSLRKFTSNYHKGVARAESERIKYQNELVKVGNKIDPDQFLEIGLYGAIADTKSVEGGDREAEVEQNMEFVRQSLAAKLEAVKAGKYTAQTSDSVQEEIDAFESIVDKIRKKGFKNALSKKQKDYYDKLRSVLTELAPQVQDIALSQYGELIELSPFYIPRKALGSITPGTDQSINDYDDNFLDSVFADRFEGNQPKSYQSPYEKARKKTEGVYYSYDINMVIQDYLTKTLFDIHATPPVKALSQAFAQKDENGNYAIRETIGQENERILIENFKKSIDNARGKMYQMGILMKMLGRVRNTWVGGVIGNATQFVTQMFSGFAQAAASQGSVNTGKAIRMLADPSINTTEWFDQHAPEINNRNSFFEMDLNARLSTKRKEWKVTKMARKGMKKVSLPKGAAENAGTFLLKFGDMKAAKVMFLASYLNAGGTLESPDQASIDKALSDTEILQGVSDPSNAPRLLLPTSGRHALFKDLFFALKSFALKDTMNIMYASKELAKGRGHNFAKILFPTVVGQLAFQYLKDFIANPLYD